MGSGGPQQFGGLGGLEDLLGGLTGGRSSGTEGTRGGSSGGLGGMGAGGGGLASIAMAVLSMLMSQRGQGGAGGLGGAAGTGGSGGLGGLLEKLQQGGLGNQTRSWVGSGENDSVSATQVQEALGDDAVNEVAARAGVSREEAAQGLAGVLPQLVDRLTPEGQVPDNDQLKGMLGGLAPK